MSEVKDGVLPNGHTFLAIVTGYVHFAWAKAADPVTAIRNAYKHHEGSENKIPIYCIYGKDDEIFATELAGYEYKTSNPPIPIGIFTVTKSSIRAVKKGDFNNEHDDCFEWTTKKIMHLAKSEQEKSDEC